MSPRRRHAGSARSAAARDASRSGDVDTNVTVRRVERGDLYVRVNTIGDTGERAFLLVPGIGVSSDYFERLAPNLNEFGPVHALDLPGFAGVPHPGHALTIREYADLVGTAIDELGLDDPVVVGHSMGTQIVVDLAARRPDLSTVVLIGPVIDPAHRHVLEQAVRFARAAWHEPGRVKFLALSAYVLCGVRWFSRIMPKMMTYPIEQHLPQIAADTLVIRGEHDAVAPREWVRRVGELLPSSRLWEMPGAAHSVMHAHAEEVAKLCVEHAQQPITHDEGDELHHYVDAGDGDESDDFSPSPADFVTAVGARLRSTAATMRGDDEALAEAKTDHAESMQAAFDRRQAEKVAAGDEPDDGPHIEPTTGDARR